MIRARPGCATTRIHIGMIFGPRSIGRRLFPCASRDFRSWGSSHASLQPASITLVTGGSISDNRLRTIWCHAFESGRWRRLTLASRKALPTESRSSPATCSGAKRTGQTSWRFTAAYQSWAAPLARSNAATNVKKAAQVAVKGNYWGGWNPGCRCVRETLNYYRALGRGRRTVAPKSRSPLSSPNST